MIPSILINISGIDEALKSLSTKINERKNINCHKDNFFNRRYSRLLSTFVDIKVTSERLDKNGKDIRPFSNIINLRKSKEDKDVISEEGQILRERWGILSRKIQTDLKALYLFSKIFIDEFIGLMSLILELENKKILVKTRQGGYSIGVLYRSLEKYKGDDMVVLELIDKTLGRFKAVEVYLSEYRNNYIQHLDSDDKKDIKWTSFGSRGDVRFLGNRSSLTAEELTFVVNGFICTVVDFIIITDLE